MHCGRRMPTSGRHRQQCTMGRVINIAQRPQATCSGRPWMGENLWQVMATIDSHVSDLITAFQRHPSWSSSVNDGHHWEAMNSPASQAPRVQPLCAIIALTWKLQGVMEGAHWLLSLGAINAPCHNFICSKAKYVLTGWPVCRHIYHDSMPLRLRGVKHKYGHHE